MKKKKLSPERDPSSIGNILVDMGFLNESRLLSLIDRFRASKDELLGEYIVRHTELTEEQVEVALMRQKRLRGRTNEAMVARLMEISRNSHRNMMEGVEGLKMATKVAAK